MVSVNGYGIYQNITFPLIFKVFKPKSRLKPEDKYRTKIQLATEIIEELIVFGFKIELVLADSLYGESSSFISILDRYNLSWIVAIRNNHGVLMPSHQRVRANKWCKFERKFGDGSSEIRYIREIIFGKKSYRTYWEITTDPQTMPENSTSFVMTNIQDKVKKTLGNLYGLRTWVEYAFRQCKQELGWRDYRFTNFKDIERWWEIIFSCYSMVSLNSQVFLELNQLVTTDRSNKNISQKKSIHQEWNHKSGWKNVLNNLRLLIQPTILLWAIAPWLDIFPNRHLYLGFHHLITAIEQFQSLNIFELSPSFAIS